MKNLTKLAVPGGLVLLAALVCLRPGVLPAPTLPYVRAYPYVVFGVGILLGWLFNRSRVVLALVVLAVADRALLHAGAGAGMSASSGRSVFDSVAMLLPLNLLAYAAITERGVLTPRGLTRLVPILLQALVVTLLLFVDGRVLSICLESKVIDASLTAWTPIPQPALLAFGLALVCQVVRFVRHRNPMEAGFLWLLVSAFLALQGGRSGGVPTGALATGGLVLIVALVETSYRMAYHDDLTGLPGRRALNEALLALGGRYAVAMLDIDHFKKFNDAYGHDVGDQVLRMVASKLRGISGGGKAFRYGGEEFSILFPGKSVAEAAPLLETLRKAVGASRFVVRGPGRPRKKPATPRARTGPPKEVVVTVSIGVAERDARRLASHQVIKAADAALYRAKQAGRNRVMS